MGFMDGIRDVLGGFNAVKQIDSDGFDWREKRAAQQAARDQELQQYQQANEDYLTKAGAEAAIGGMPENELDSLLPAGLDPARRRAAIARMVGQSAQAKSSLEGQRAYTQSLLQSNRDDAAMERTRQQGANAQEVVRLREKLRSGQELSPREQATLDAALERTKLQQAGANWRDQNGPPGGGRWGRPQLRLVSDGAGGTEYRWISPGETAPGAPTATQRETAGMAGNISEVLANMEEIAPDVTYGPIAGRISEAVQSQYPSGKEADFDQYIKQLVDLAYIKSGKQINKQELEMQLRGMISRSKGDLPGQVKRAKPYIENILKPYERTGAIGGGGGGIPEPRSKAERDALPPGTRYKAPDGRILVKR